MPKQKQKIFVLIGPCASGKTLLGMAIARSALTGQRVDASCPVEYIPKAANPLVIECQDAADLKQYRNLLRRDRADVLKWEIKPVE